MLVAGIPPGNDQFQPVAPPVVISVNVMHERSQKLESLATKSATGGAHGFTTMDAVAVSVPPPDDTISVTVFVPIAE